MTQLSVVVPVYGERELVRTCLRSVFEALEQVAIEAEVIVVDDASPDDAARVVAQEFPAAKLLENDVNRGFAFSVNRGTREARGELLLWLNSDTEVSGESLAAWLAYLSEHPERGALAPRLVGADGQTQRSLMRLPRLGTVAAFGTPLERWFPDSAELRRYFARDVDHEVDGEVEQPPAACWLLRRECLEGVGELDEELVLFFNDVDWARRLAASGQSFRYLAQAPIVHVGGASTRRRSDFVARWQTDRLRYYRKHHGVLGALWVKSWVCVSFLDWCVGNVRRRMLGRTAEPFGPTARAFTRFLRGKEAR